MMSEKESTQKDEDLDPIQYINTVIAHINAKIKEGDDCVVKGEHLQANTAFNNAVNHYKTRMHDLSQLQQKLFFPDMSKLDGVEETRNIYNTTSGELISLLAALEDKRKNNESAALAEEVTMEIGNKKFEVQCEVEQLTGTLQNKKIELSELTEKFDKEYAEYRKISKKTGSEFQPTTQDDSIETAFDMQVLGAFIAALGVTAVAIAFVALNAAGLAMPGVVLAGFGVGTALLGASIFSSTAKDINDYSDNICSYFVTPST